MVQQPDQDLLMVKVGEIVTLRCAASGYPNPSISWYYAHSDQDEVLDNDVIGHGLSIQLHVDRSSDGVYMCLADNGVGTSPNKTFNIMAVCK